MKIDHDHHSLSIQPLINFFYVVPYLLLFLCWLVIPIATGFLISLTKWTFIPGKYQLVGLRNYKDAFADELFLKGIINTLYYTTMTVIGGNLVSFFLAYGLTKVKRFRNVFRKILWKIDADLKNASMVSEECSKRSENIINRKIVKFYIEAISQKNSQLRKK